MWLGISRFRLQEVFFKALFEGDIFGFLRHSRERFHQLRFNINQRLQLHKKQALKVVVIPGDFISRHES